MGKQNKNEHSHLLNAMRLDRRSFLKTTGIASITAATGGLAKIKPAKAHAYGPYPEDDQLLVILTAGVTGEL